MGSRGWLLGLIVCWSVTGSGLKKVPFFQRAFSLIQIISWGWFSGNAPKLLYQYDGGAATAGRRCQVPLEWVCSQIHDKVEQHPVPLFSQLSQQGPAQAPRKTGWMPSLEHPLHSPRMPFYQHTFGQQIKNPFRKLRSKFTSRVTEVAGTSANQRVFPKKYIAIDSRGSKGCP